MYLQKKITRLFLLCCISIAFLFSCKYNIKQDNKAETLTKDSLPAKEKINPYVAATLSAIIPGSGHCYARHRADGLISFITIAVLSAATYFAYSQGSIALTCTLGTLTAIGYAGNVYSAYNSAIHTQETMNNNYRTELNRYLEYNPEQFLPQWMKK